MNCRKLFSLAFAAVLVLSLLPALGLAQDSTKPAGGTAEIEAELLDALNTEGAANFFVVMAEKADLSPAYEIDDWGVRGWFVYNALREVAARSQASVIEYAEKNGLAYRSFYTVNSVYIEMGDRTAVEGLAQIPGVALLRLEKFAQIEPLEKANQADPEAYGWNLSTLDPASSQYGMQAAQVWSQYGVKGDGIVVANIDTGAFYEHEALDRQYRGNLTGNIGGPYDHDFNWYMPTSGCGDGTYPCDNNGHGSGTMGIMAGEKQDLTEQIGIAPEAKWMACKGCETTGCSDAALTGCADWMVAPCPINIDPGDPSCDPNMRPHIVNNSWGGGGCDTWYQGYVQAWVASGIFPAFSAGNTVGCSTLGSPGDNPESFGTAAHDSTGDNLYAGGPSCFFPTPSCDPNAHQIDPHLNAPTFGRTSDNAQGTYFNLSGTSGASPHTAGTVALIWSGNPSYIGQIGQTFTILEQTTNHNVPAGSCGKPACAGTNVYPNYEYGWGYLDALAAVTMAGVGGQGALNGTVTEAAPLAAPGDPLAGITVDADRMGGGGKTATTDATGYYSMTLTSGTYTVTAEGPRHSAQTFTGIVIVTDTVVVQDFQLQPRSLLFGYVTDLNSGAPLVAAVTVEGVDTLPTDPATGYYSIYLDVGTYDVTAEATDYASQTVSVNMVLGAPTQQDFALLAAIAVVPDPIAITLELGQTGSVGSVITNNMVANYPFEFREFELGAAANGGSVQGSGGPDPFGYTYQDSDEPGGARYEWIDATDGTPLNLTDDSEANVTLPFAFTFYGTSSTDIRVGNNGGLFFGVTTGDLPTTNGDLSTTTYNNLVVPFWDDIDADTGNVYYKTVGTAPNRQFVVEWFNRPHYSNIGSGTFELILYEGTNNIKYQYLDTNFGNASYDYGVSATSGIRQTGSNYLQYSYNQAVLVDGLAICFQYPGSPPCDGGDVTWYGTSITSGTVPAGASLAWTNYFTATPAAGVVAPGVYNARLGIYPTTAGLPSRQVGVILTVLPTANLGKLEGTVTSDRPGGPLEADVLIEASGGTTVALTTDPATGYYFCWLEQGLYDVTASADGHVPETAQVQVTGQQTTTQDFQLALIAPEISVTPPALEETLQLGQTAARTLTIGNDGLLPLSYDIGEVDNGYMPLALCEEVYGSTASPWGPGGTRDRGNIFEATEDTVISEIRVYLNFSVATDLYFIVYEGNAVVGSYSQILATQVTGVGPGEGWYSSGPIAVQAEAGKFYYVGASWNGSANYYRGTEPTPITTNCFGVLHTGVPGDLAGYPPAATINNTYNSGGFSPYYFTVVTGGGDVPWLSEDPVSGTVPIGDQVDVQVTFDAGAVAEPGVYMAELRVQNNDPFNGMVSVPVTMTVLPGVDLGKLEGTVTGTGYCGADSYPLEASLLIEASGGVTWTMTTDPATGYYYRWLDAGTYTVTVSAPEHVDGVEVVQITGQQTTTQDFALRFIESCMDVTPTSFSLTLPVDTQLTELLTIDNSGAGELLWELRETTSTLQLATGQGVYPPMVDTTSSPADAMPDMIPAPPVSLEGIDGWGTATIMPGTGRYRMGSISDDCNRIWSLGGGGATTGSSDVMVYDSAADAWTTGLTPIPNAGQNWQAAHINGKIYLPGGYNGAHNNWLQIYDIAGNSWSAGANMGTAKSPMAAAWDGKLYVFGGNPGPLNTVDVYDPATNAWTTGLAPMSTARAYGRAITIGDYIYVVGGNAASGISALVERYDPAANTWTAAPSMPTARADADVFAVGDYLYVTGGISSFVLPWTPTNAVERYYLPNFPGGAWETMPAAPEAFGGAAFGCANDRMWSIGGAGPNTTFYTTNRWNDEGLPCSSCAPGLVWMDIPWVTEVPTNGVVPPDTAFDVDVTFDTTGLTVGECYTGSLGLLHDDPGWASPFFIPLMLCVEEACEEVAGVELSVVSPGPFYPGATVEFSADIAPDGFTGPYNYSINGGPVQVSGDDPLLFSLTFTEPGTQTVEIAVWNCDMSAPATDTVEVIVNYYTTYLPMILKNY